MGHIFWRTSWKRTHGGTSGTRAFTITELCHHIRNLFYLFSSRSQPQVHTEKKEFNSNSSSQTCPGAMETNSLLSHHRPHPQLTVLLSLQWCKLEGDTCQLSHARGRMWSKLIHSGTNLSISCKALKSILEHCPHFLWAVLIPNGWNVDQFFHIKLFQMRLIWLISNKYLVPRVGTKVYRCG